MNRDWRDRLFEEMRRKGVSANRLSIESGLGQNYLNQVQKAGKEPTISNFLKICATLDVSPIYILSGISMTRQDEELISLLASLPDDAVDGFVDLIKTLALSEDAQE